MAYPKKRKSKIRYKACKACKNDVCKACKGTSKIRIVKGRTKGANFERNIAKQVSSWSGMTFTRTPSSGGWNKNGDITPKNPAHMVDFPFNMELKNQEILEFSSIFSVPKNSKTPIRKWWKQAFGDAKKSGKIPVLIFTKAREEVFCMVQRSMFNILQLHSVSKVQVHLDKHIVVLWEDFLSVPYLKMKQRIARG